MMKKRNFSFRESQEALLPVRYIREKGFSLIELMVALVVGLLIILAATQLFISINRLDDRVRASADRQESLRYFYDSLVFDVRNATSLSYNSDSQELILQFAGFTSSSECAGGSSGYSKVYHYMDAGPSGGGDSGIYAETLCLLVGSEEDVSVDPELLVSGEIASSLSFSFLPGLYGLRVVLSLTDPQGRLPDEELTFYVANRNVGANKWE